MEVLYVLIPVVENKEEVFNRELKNLFPLAKMKYLTLFGQRLLILYFDVQYLTRNRQVSDEQIYMAENKVQEFGRRHPYLKLGFIQMTGAGALRFFDGFLFKNRNKLVEVDGLDTSYVSILQGLIPQFTGQDFEPFTPSFVRES